MNQITYFLATENLLDRGLHFSLLQLLSKFGIVKPEIDPYLKTAQYLQELHFSNGNYCEIGTGIYLRLSELITYFTRKKKAFNNIRPLNHIQSNATYNHF